MLQRRIFDFKKGMAAPVYGPNEAGNGPCLVNFKSWLWIVERLEGKDDLKPMFQGVICNRIWLGMTGNGL